MTKGWTAFKAAWGISGAVLNAGNPVVANLAGGAITGAIASENYKKLNKTDESLYNRVDFLRFIEVSESFQSNLEMGIIYDMVGRAIRDEDIATVYRDAVMEFVAGESFYKAGVRLPIARNVIGLAKNFTGFLWDEYENVDKILDILGDQEEIIKLGQSDWSFLVKARKYMWLLNKKNVGRYIETEQDWSKHLDANSLVNEYLNMIKDYQRDLHNSNKCGHECRFC